MFFLAFADIIDITKELPLTAVVSIKSKICETLHVTCTLHQRCRQVINGGRFAPILQMGVMQMYITLEELLCFGMFVIALIALLKDKH